MSQSRARDRWRFNSPALRHRHESLHRRSGGYGNKPEFSPIQTLPGFSLVISSAPLLRPSYAVALLLVTYGGVVQHKIEKVIKQEL